MKHKEEKAKAKARKRQQAKASRRMRHLTGEHSIPSEGGSSLSDLEVSPPPLYGRDTSVRSPKSRRTAKAVPFLDTTKEAEEAGASVVDVTVADLGRAGQAPPSSTTSNQEDALALPLKETMGDSVYNEGGYGMINGSAGVPGVQLPMEAAYLLPKIGGKG